MVNCSENFIGYRKTVKAKDNIYADKQMIVTFNININIYINLSVMKDAPKVYV